jgi:hypothetical protein
MRLATKEQRQQYRQAVTGAGYARDPRSTEYAEVYTCDNGRLSAKGFIGTAGKPSFYYTFRNEAQREAHIVKFFAQAQAHLDRKQAWREQKKAFVHTLKVGQLMSGSWGYDQTNCELWEVTRLIGKCTAELRKVITKTVPGSEGFMCESVVPVKGSYCDRTEPVIARIQEGNRCRIHECCHVSPCDENSKHYSSWYA